ncbi:MAG TPA: hypothetical protein DCQ98_17875 [Planctomycetaceae bacterium]|nr:hypothetical protein [Planctomycetaceae bacterium]HRE99472.1 hypothetical protein [Pirellulaceae bacterium]
MNATFDPYRDWLGIAADERPPHHYALLGVAPFAADSGTFEREFQERYRRIRRYQVGEHGDDAVRLLNELAKAFETLSQPEARRRYDEQLRRERPELAALAESTKPNPDPTSSGQGSDAPERIASVPPSTSLAARKSTGRAPAAALTSDVSDEASGLVGYRVLDRTSGRQWGPMSFDQLCLGVENDKIDPDWWIVHADWPKPRRAVTVFPELARGARRNLEAVPPTLSTQADPFATNLAPALPAPALAPTKPLRPVRKGFNWIWGMVAAVVILGAILLVLVVIAVRSLFPGFDPASTLARGIRRSGFPSNAERIYQPTGAKVDLLSMLDPFRDSERIPWSRQGNSLVSPPGGPGQLVVRLTAPASYRVVIEARRLNGIESINVGLPVTNGPGMEGQVFAVFDGFGGSVNGLSMVDGRTPDANGTATNGQHFADAEFHTIEIFVIPGSITAYVDDERVIEWSGEPRSLMVDPRFWSNFHRDKLMLATWSSSYEVRRFDLYPGI